MTSDDLSFVPESPRFVGGPSIPPRSRLMALEPIGIGTSAVESLTSYIVRLADAYSVSPRRLIMEEFTKVSPEIGRYRRHGLFFENDARSIDGLHQHSQSFTSAIEKLCGLGNAKLLTLLNLKNLLPFNGAGLIAAHPRWCPVCNQERLSSCQALYHPLVWSFDLYHTCAKHGAVMLDRCPSCGAYQHVIPRSPMLGFCCHCGIWLGQKIAERVSGDDTDIWLATAIEEIVSELPSVQELATRENFVCQLKRAINIYTEGGQCRFCRAIGLPERDSQFWLSANRKPSLPLWLSVAYGLGVSPVSFLKGQIRQRGDIDELRSIERTLKQRTKRRKLTAAQRQALEAELRLVAMKGHGSTTITMIAEKHQLTRTYLRRLWPDLSKRITSAYRARSAKLAKEEQRRQCAIVEAIVGDFLVRGVFPSQRIVKSALEQTKISFANPAIRAAYKRQLIQRKAPH